MTAQDLAAAIAGIVETMSALPDQREQLLPALRILTALQAEQLSAEQDPRVSQLVRLERELADRDPGERARIIRKRMGISRATYYRLRADLNLSCT